MSEVNLTDWNHFLDKNHPNAHLLQMGEWGELKRGFGWKPVRFISTRLRQSTHRILNNEVGCQILFRRLPLGLTLGYLPKAAISFQQLALSDEFWNEVDSICKQNHAIFLKIEPDVWEDQSSITTSHLNSVSLSDSEGSLPPNVRDSHLHWRAAQVSVAENAPSERHGIFEMGSNSYLRISPHNIQPPRTILISIKDNEETILARMKPKCRYNIRLAEKKGVTVRAWDDIPAFHEMMTVTGGRDNFGVHSLEYYQRAYELFHPKGTCELLVAEYENKPLAALMVFANGTRAWYVYGASNDEGRNRMPTYLLQWEAIRWAKARGCEEYDLWGVPDENEETLEANFETRHDGLWGVYRFKRGFGGEVKRAAQALDRVYNPLLYWAYLKFIGNRE